MGLPTQVVPDKNPCHLYDDIEYGEYWQGLQKSKIDQLERAIVQELLPPAGQSIIDLGCGFGRLFNCYADRFKRVVLFDGSMSLLRRAREFTAGKAVYVAGDIYHLPFHPASFDNSIMIRVFHHLDNSPGVLSEINRVLCGQGRLVFTYRNLLGPRYILDWIMRRLPEHPFTAEMSGLGSTLIAHHPAYVRQALEQSGFSNIAYRGAGIMDKVARKSGPLGKWIPIGKSLAPILGSLKIAPWIFCGVNSIKNTPLYDGRIVDDLFCCPVCKADLIHEAEAYSCPACNLKFPVADGIFDFRLD